MRISDAIEYVESRFECAMGDYGSHVNLLDPDDRRRYVLMHKYAPTLDATDPVTEHILASAFVNQFGLIADRMNRNGLRRPRLWWRYERKIDMECNDDGISWVRTRVFIDGCDDYGAYVHHDILPHHLQMVIDNCSDIKRPMVVHAVVSICDDSPSVA